MCAVVTRHTANGPGGKINCIGWVFLSVFNGLALIAQLCNRISMYLKNVNISGVLEPAALCALSNEKNPFWVIAGEVRGCRAGTEGGKT